MSTVYILGAGASADLKLPVGEKLKEEIGNLFKITRSLNGYQFENNELQRLYSNFVTVNEGYRADELMATGDQIRATMPVAFSIDNYLDAHKDNELQTRLGKMAILNCILSKEKESPLFIDTSKNTISDALQAKTWHRSLFQSLAENCNFSEFKERLKTITFIVFNYDRCLEHYLILATLTYYRISTEEAAEAINSISFIHPYGQCGALPWQVKSSENDLILKFGEEVPISELLNHSEIIKTFTEYSEEETTIRTRAHEAITNASRVVSLGFAFHPMNMNWLKPSNPLPRINVNVDVYASALDVSLSDRSVIENMCSNAFSMGSAGFSRNTNVYFSGLEDDCQRFYSQYSLSIGYGNHLEN